MKSFLSLLVCVLAIHFTSAQNTTVAPQQNSTTTVTPLQKTCKDFLPEQTCDSLIKLAQKLKESASVVQAAVNAAIAAHKTNTVEMLGFIRGYIAERLQCNQVVSDKLCTALFNVAKRLKLTAQQVKLAIEAAVNSGKETAKDIYAKAIALLTGQISCEKIFGPAACNNIKSAMDKFHEQRSLLKEAIMSVALRNYNTAKEMLGAVKSFVISKIVNFNCTDVLPSTVCQKITSIAQRLKILPSKVKEAIEMAILNGATTAAAIYKGVIDFLTDNIKCEKILTPTACQNLVNATMKLHEQVHLIKEAIMEAALKHITDAKAILKNVRDVLIKKAKNFNCTDVLSERQCTLLKNIVGKFHLSALTLRNLLLESVVNGTATARAIYQATLGALIADAKDLKCEDLISSDACLILNAFAAKLKISAQQVTLAVKESIIAGKQKIKDIIVFVKNIIVDERSCKDFFPRLTATVICKGLEYAAYVKGITFDRVIKKIRDLYASGLTKFSVIRQKLRDFFHSIHHTVKRSIDASDSVSIKDEFIDWILTIFGGIHKVAQKARENIKNELKKLYDSGKLRITNFRKVIKGLLAKYYPSGDEQEDMVTDLKQKIEDLKNKAKEHMNELLAKLRAEYERLMKLLPNEDHQKDYISNIENLALQSIDDEVEDAIRSF